MLKVFYENNYTLSSGNLHVNLIEYIMNQYADKQFAEQYDSYLASKNGKIQKQVLGDAILSSLQATGHKLVLDAACGNGWLTKLLADQGFIVQGCDNSKPLLDEARRLYPNLQFDEADLTQSLPYSENYFNAIVLNMAIIDVPDVDQTLKNLHRVLKPGGTLIMTLPHPDYTYPVAVWKRDIMGWLLGKKPKLILRTKPTAETKIDTGSFATFWRPLDYYSNSAAACGLALLNKVEIKPKKDSSEFDLNYQLYRYPLLLLLEFKKR